MISDADLEQEFEDHIDLTPLIDAMFLLLIFFIMATTFSKPVMDVVLPHAESGGKKGSENKQMVVSISKEGLVFHKGLQITTEKLPELMALNPELTLNFYVDQTAPFHAFVRVLDQARLKRSSDIVITTEPSKNK